jgi:hypothetical protein
MKNADDADRGFGPAMFFIRIIRTESVSSAGLLARGDFVLTRIIR